MEMLSTFDFVLFGAIAVLSSLLTEFIKNLVSEEKIANKKILAIIISGVAAIIGIFCKAVFIEQPTFDIQYWTMAILTVLFSCVASQLTYDKVIAAIKELIVALQ